ncbi:carboxylesterase/lipase family protein [Brevundimonas sp. PAMC22021]|uniref:carboxylesterase/lipase family protein n=1 Tax=Brevundimonas sp. PAMC22021 TaxID=2861285 RepID=UPI001C62CA11|nr:carboxylesterase family protein [Brevundimonas sp. PAMC22021]QYF86949.1 carboxylesterase family protein [Brevundimonas sp. PAMC22021]
MIPKIVALGMALALLTGASASAETPPVVTAPAGAVRGVVEGEIASFKGIPYAAPPVGEMRWRPPAPARAWNGERDATRYGAACVQPTPGAPSIYSADLGRTSEDCLTLNVWTPSATGKAPVMVWIHGGALVTGSSKETLYDGARLAREGVVVVSINYRLGVLGWLSHPDLSAESPASVSGNYGLMDQVSALQWVKQNIASFGGDPENVTIAGESAGGLSVLYLMSSPLARGLFDRAVAQSAYMISTPELKEARHGAPAAEAAGATLARTLQAPSLRALRGLDAQELTDRAALGGFATFGVIDGVVLPRQIVDVFDRGEQAKVPVLAGFNSGEIRSLRILAPPVPGSTAEYERVIRERYGDLAEEFLRLYPSSEMEESILATTRDALYGWTSERLVRSQTAAGQSSFLYLFDHGYPAADAAGLRAFHASELPFMFGNLQRTPPRWPAISSAQKEAHLSDAMIAYWTSFMRSGAPEAEGYPTWASYGVGEAFMTFRDSPVPEKDLSPGMFELHDATVERRRATGDQPWNWNTGLASPALSKSASH